MMEERRARDDSDSPVEYLKKVFGPHLVSESDAVFLGADEKRVLGVSGLPFYAPCAVCLYNEEKINSFIGDIKGSCLFVFADGFFSCDRAYSFGEPVFYTERGKVLLPEDVSAAVKYVAERMCLSAGFLDDDGRQHVDLKGYPVGPHYAVNLLLGDRTEFEAPLFTTPKSAVDAFGRGSFRSGGSQQVLATRYVVFPEENGEPANRQFYIFENGKKIFYSLDIKHTKKAECVHSPNFTEIVYETESGLNIRREIFLLPQKAGMPIATEVQRVRIRKEGKSARLKVVFTGVFGICSPETIINDVVYANVVNQGQITYRDGKSVAYSLDNKDFSLRGEKKFFALITNGKAGFDDFCCDSAEFIGGGSLSEPENAIGMSCRLARKSAQFFAVGKYVTVGKEWTELATFTGICEKPGTEGYDVGKDFEVQLENLLDYFSEEGSIDKILAEIRRNYENYTEYLHLNGEGLGTYVSNNLPFQVLYQTFVSRSFAWTQKAYRETGFREIQDIYASMNYLVACGKSVLVKNLLSKWAENVFEMGYAWHDFTWRGKGAGVCSDDQLWLVPAIYRYVRLTGDYGFLSEEFSIAGSKHSRTLWETLRAVLVYSGKISVGKHGLPLLDRADWNDTLRLDKEVLDGPTKESEYRRQLENSGKPYGSPFENTLTESVMNACLLKIAADMTAKLAEETGRSELSTFARGISVDTEISVRKFCWKENFYARTLINDNREGGYTYLGAKGDGLSLDPTIDGTYYLNSYGWTILAGIADEEQIATMLDVVNSYLKVDAGLKLCTLVDYNLLGTDTATGLYYAGDRENGGVFKHAAMMAARASLVAAKRVKNEELAVRLAELADFAIEKTLPYTTLKDPFVIKGNPRFCTQYNNSVTGENVGPILSGTASWLMLCIYEMLGFSECREDIIFSPILPASRGEYQYVLKSNKTEISVRVSGGLRLNCLSRCRVDGRSVSRPIVAKDGKKHTVEISL